MNKLTFKIKTVLVMSSIVMIFIVIFCDSSILNSLVVQNEDVFIEEVAVVSDNKTQQVISNDTDNNVTMLSNKADLNNWAWPTDGNYIITSYFGYRWGGMHNAIDISGTGYGSNIYAANNGVVTSVMGGCVAGNTSCNGRGGNYIVINHNSNNYYTLYMHLKDIKVSVGQVVSKGQVIGTMGNTGDVVPVPTASSPYNGTHLHFCLYVGEPYNGGYAVNPMSLY